MRDFQKAKTYVSGHSQILNICIIWSRPKTKSSNKKEPTMAFWKIRVISKDTTLNLIPKRWANNNLPKLNKLHMNE